MPLLLVCRPSASFDLDPPRGHAPARPCHPAHPVPGSPWHGLAVPHTPAQEVYTFRTQSGGKASGFLVERGSRLQDTSGQQCRRS
eukprot:3254008-Pyramimonas_sp.AAC.1